MQIDKNRHNRTINRSLEVEQRCYRHFLDTCSLPRNTCCNTIHPE